MPESISIVLASKGSISLPQVNSVLNRYQDVVGYSSTRSGSQVTLTIELNDQIEQVQFLDRFATDLDGSLQGIASGTGTYNLIRLDMSSNSRGLLRRLGRFPGRNSTPKPNFTASQSITEPVGLTDIPGQRSTTSIAITTPQTQSNVQTHPRTSIARYTVLTSPGRLEEFLALVWLGFLTALAIVTEPFSRDSK